MAGEEFVDVTDLDAIGSEQVAVVAGLVVIDAAESLDVVDDDKAEFTTSTLGLLHHVLKGLPALRSSAGDPHGARCGGRLRMEPNLNEQMGARCVSTMDR